MHARTTNYKHTSERREIKLNIFYQYKNETKPLFLLTISTLPIDVTWKLEPKNKKNRCVAFNKTH